MNDWKRDRMRAERYKQMYPKGTRIELIQMGGYGQMLTAFQPCMSELDVLSTKKPDCWYERLKTGAGVWNCI